MKTFYKLFSIGFFVLISSFLTHAQEIRMVTTYKTNPTELKQFGFKIGAPQGTYYIDYGDGTGTQSKYSSGKAIETVFYHFADMDLQEQHTIKIWGLNFTHITILSNREVQEVDLENCTDLTYFSCANNLLKKLDLGGCTQLKTLICNNNQIEKLVVPSSLTEITFSHNRIKLSDFPQKRPEIVAYNYGPMRPAYLSTDKIQGNRVDLSEMLSFEGTPSSFAWYRFNNKGNNADPKMKIDPSTYSEEEGVFTFNQIPEGSIYCVVTNSKLPRLANINDQYGIMPIIIQGENRQLEKIHASFITDKFTTEGLTFDLTLAASQNNSSTTIDWGDGVFQDVVLGTQPQTIKHHFLDAKVDKEHRISIQCENLKLLQLPELGGLLRTAPITASCPVEELIISNNRMNEIDLTSFDRCKKIEANSCYLNTLVLPGKAPLEKLSLRNNNLSDINLLSFSEIREFDISYNKIETLLLASFNHPEVINIMNNKIRYIEWPKNMESLKQLNCSHNAIPMYHLPQKRQMTSYIYAPQESFKIESELVSGSTIDLSQFTNLVGVADSPQKTTFIWLHADDESIFVAEGLHYDHVNGKFSFKFTESTRIFCTMQTQAFPDLAGGNNSYRTLPITVFPVGIEEIENARPSIISDHGNLCISSPQGANYEIYTSDGTLIHKGNLSPREEKSLSLLPGLYIVRMGAETFKASHF